MSSSLDHLADRLWGVTAYRDMGLIIGYRERTSLDCTRFLMGCVGEKPKTKKRRDQGSLGNKDGKIEG